MTDQTRQERSTHEMALLVLTTLHVIPYLRWEREGDETFETRRARLLDTLALIAGMMSADGGSKLRHLLLGGQTVLLEDIAPLRPDLLTFLIVCNATHRVEIGPWYIQVDDTLVSGESLIRNLLAARVDSDRHGIALSTVAYTPDLTGHPAQLPQILRGFGIDTAFLHHAVSNVHLPFRWEAPDGSTVLVMSHDKRQNAALSVRDQCSVKPDGPFLWMGAADQPDKLAPIGISMPVLQTSLMTYAAALRKGFDDELRPLLHGEIRMQGKRADGQADGDLFPGTLSTRLHLKQKNAALQTLLTYAAEPWLALALTHGKPAHPENLRMLLATSWRQLMKNQARPVLGGYAADSVELESEVRSRQVEDAAKHLVQRALHALPGTPQTSTTTRNITYVVVWNSHNWLVRQSVEIVLDIPADLHPIKMLSAGGNETLFSWSPQTRRLSFLAEAPSVGYTTYTLALGDTPLPETLVQRSTATTIADSSGATLSAETGELIWREGALQVHDVLRFIDGGDAGNVFHYRSPVEDVIEQATLVSGIMAESSPVYERLIFRHRMRVAPALRPDRSRDRGVRLMEFTTTASFYDGMPGVYFHTDFTNTAEDHRLRVHLRTGIQSKTVLADTAFGILERPAGITSTYPMQEITAVQNQQRAVALLVNGLPEFEAIHEDAQTTFALTLVRAIAGAQSLRSVSADYALMPLPTNDFAALIRAGNSYNAPLQAYQYEQRPDKLQRSYLSIQSSLGIGGDSDGNGAILTALKPPQNGKGWILRLLNPTNERVEVSVTPNRRAKYVRLANLAEEPLLIIEPDANGTIHLTIEAQKLVTLRLSFG